jgi:arginine utilization regulatory protein
MIESVFAGLKNLQHSLRPLILCGNAGTGKQFLAEQLHTASIYRDRPCITINLGQYTEEAQRWAILKNAFAEIPSGIESFSEFLAGTVYIQGLENTDVLFIVSLLEWLSRIGNQNIFGPQLRIILGIEESLQELIPQEFLKTFDLLTLPTLAAHREDIPTVLQWLVEKYNRQYYRHIRHISLELLHYFMQRPWSGNIEELRYNLETVFLALPESMTTLTVEEAITHQTTLKG